jgi:putative endonuclease
MYYVYILYSESADHYYIGQTNNLNARIQKHNKGAIGYTRYGRPWKVLWCTGKGTRKEAILLERKLKNLSRDRLGIFMKKYSDEFKFRRSRM